MSAKPIHGTPKPSDVPEGMQDTPPRPFPYRVGQVVCYTNGNGISATARIRGFTKEPEDRFVYLEHWSGSGWSVGAWWFAVSPDDISPERNFAKPAAFVPFPVGTVRGPYHGRYPGQLAQTQFLVQGKGGWVPFIRIGRNCEAEARQAAEKYAEGLKD